LLFNGASATPIAPEKPTRQRAQHCNGIDPQVPSAPVVFSSDEGINQQWWDCFNQTGLGNLQVMHTVQCRLHIAE
jgi:hypothetical protein